MKITEIVFEDAQPPYDVQVVIENEDGSTTTMPKILWDAQQEAAELGETL